MPAKIIATDYISLDGVIQDPVGMEGSGLGDWIGPFTRGPAGDQFKRDELLAAGAMIFGRVTYDGFAAVWPTASDQGGLAQRMNSLPKFVASTTLENADWSNSQIIDGDLIHAATDLKAHCDGNILIYGSASIVHQLIPAGLVDEYCLMIYPTVLGRGKRLFPDDFAARLQLLDNRQFGDGIVMLRYASSHA